MKNIKEILNHLPVPYNNKIKIQRCLKILISTLPKTQQKYILYTYLKGETLYIVTKHQAINFELYQKLSDIKTALSLIQKNLKKCNSIKISSLKAYTTYTKPRKTIQKIENFTLRKELKGNFENLAKNKKIYKVFEEIREIIKNKSK